MSLDRIRWILSRIRIITFDIDLTLAYMNDAVENADRALFEYVTNYYPQLGISYPEEIMDTMEEILRSNNNNYKNIGDLRRNVLATYVDKTSYDRSVADELFDLWRTERNKTTLIPYARDLIQLLHRHGYILGIITNGTADLSGHPDVNSLFSAFVNSDLCGDRKPTRVPFDKMKEILGIYDSSMYLHVGDDYASDVEGANNSGWKSVLISTNFSRPPKGKKAPDICKNSLFVVHIIIMESSTDNSSVAVTPIEISHEEVKVANTNKAKCNDISPSSETDKRDSVETTTVVNEIPLEKPRSASSCCARFWHNYIPISEWLPKYKKDYFSFDLIAGLTVGIMAIPQGMAYAMLANLPPIYGLYGCITPVFMYAIFGTSRHVHIGPFALVSMMVASTLSFLNPDEDQSGYLSAVSTLCFICGILWLLLGICRCGVVTRLLSETIVTAFTTASAFNIGGSQLKHYWGVSCSESVFLKIVQSLFFTDLRNSFNWWSFLLGASATVILYAMKVLNKKYLPKKPLPVELFLLIIYIFVMWVFDLKHRWNLKYLGDYDIVRGMPPFLTPDFKNLGNIIPGAVMICIVGYAITVSLGKIFARRFGYPLNDNQELVALGAASIMGSFLSCYPPAGSLSRTALIANCEAKSQLHNFISPLLIIFCLYVLTDIIIYIPNASLAAIVIVNLFSLWAQFSELKPLWRTSWADFWSFVVCVVLTITMGTEAGLIGGVASSLVFLLVCVLIARKQAKKEEVKDLALPDSYFVVTAPIALHFMNRDTYRGRVESLITQKKVVLDLRRVCYIDASALMTLQELVKHCNKTEERLILFATSDYVEGKLHAYGSEGVTISKSVPMSDL